VNHSLSVLLPVQNVQANLHTDVQHVLEVLPELTKQFELLIVDDGSTDATYEVACELARDYPQISLIRHAEPLGWSASVAREVTKANGDFIIIHSGGPVQAADIAGLWRLRQGVAAAAMAKAKAAQSGKKYRIDSQIITNTPDEDQNASPASRATRGLGIHARAPRSNLLLVHRQQLGQLGRSLKTLAAQNKPATHHDRRHGAEPIKSPTFLSRVKTFALGE
jgi:hypothetical protein